MGDSLKTRRLKHPESITNVFEAVRFLHAYRDYKRERIIVVHMTPCLEAFAIQISAIGSMGAVNCEMHDIFRKAILMDTKLIIVAHNHPYERTIHVSPEDKDFTESVVEAGRCLRIPVLDHIILGPDDFYSYRMNGQCFPPSSEYYVDGKDERFKLKSEYLKKFVFHLNCRKTRKRPRRQS